LPIVGESLVVYEYTIKTNVGPFDAIPNFTTDHPFSCDRHLTYEFIANNADVDPTVASDSDLFP